MGMRLKKIKIDNENNKKTVCFNKRVIEYSVPIREYIANKPIKDNNKGKINNFFSKKYQFEPIRLSSSLKSKFFKF